MTLYLLVTLRSLARSMAYTKQVKAANILNNAFTTAGGDGVSLVNTAHPTALGGNFSNRSATDADLNETSLEQAMIDIAGFIDERGLKIAMQGRKLNFTCKHSVCSRQNFKFYSKSRYCRQ